MLPDMNECKCAHSYFSIWNLGTAEERISLIACSPETSFIAFFFFSKSGQDQIKDPLLSFFVGFLIICIGIKNH